jgi:hypothetical protein
MHHAGGAAPFSLTPSQQLEHGLRGISAVNDHRLVELDCQIKLRTEHRQLLLEIFIAEQIKAELPDGDHPRILLGGITQHIHRCGLPMLGIEGVDAHRVTHFREAVSEGTDRRNLRRLNASVQQRDHTRLSPTT